MNQTALPAVIDDLHIAAPPAAHPQRKTAKEVITDYFGAKISNDNTRAAYMRDAREFGRWIAGNGLALDAVTTLNVAQYRDHLKAAKQSPATIKRKISALRKLLSYMVETGTLSYNPAREVTTEPVRRSEGKTAALDVEQMCQLFESFTPKDGELWRPIDLRDRAIIGVMAYTLARVSAVCNLRAQDYIDLGRHCMLRLHEKGGVDRDIPVHPDLIEYLDAWIKQSGVKGAAVLFPAFDRKNQTDRPLSRVDAFVMVKRCLKRAGLPISYSNHSFRATGITQFLEGGGKLETAQQLANHADSRTTKLYDRRSSRLELSEIARIRYVRD